MIRIGICGTHCSGKSTLVDDLTGALHLPVIKEVAGMFSEPQRQQYVNQYRIVKAQIAAEEARPEFISDRTVFDNWAYLNYYMDRCNDPGMAEKVAQMAWDDILKHVITNPYTHVVFINEYFPLEDDGNRNLNPGTQKFIFEFLRDRMQPFSTFFCIPILFLAGNREHRRDKILNWIGQPAQ